jgi:basic membrane protein A and related proteins
MKKFRILTYVALAGAAFALTGCGNNNTDQQPVDVSTLIKDGTHLNFSMVTDTGGVQDRSFNQSAWEGLRLANDHFGISAAYIETHQEADYLSALETLVGRNNEIIFGIGFRIAGAMEEIAREHPDQKFAIVDYVFDPVIPNVTNIVFNDHEASYLVGYIAGSMTETNRIGFIGGMESTVIGRFEYGFRAGVASSNPDAIVDVQYANSFSDQIFGRTSATNMYRNGVDIIFHAAGDVGVGVIEAAVEEDQWVIGVDRDQLYLAPYNTLTSTMKQVGTALYEIVESVIDESFEPGTTMEFGLSNGGVGIAPTSNIHVPADILAEVTGPITDEIISGERFVPSNSEEFELFMSML